MRLLVLTQKVDINDDLLGAFHRWFEEFAKHCEKVIIICLYQGEHRLPQNVKVLSLGKERYSYHSHVIRRLVSLFNFYKYIWQERKNHDAVFVHMNIEYILLGGWLWKLWHKKIGLWYAHGSVPLRLRIAEKLADVIFTSTKSGFRIKSDKVRVVGQGIDTEKFKPSVVSRQSSDRFKIIGVGRISPSKDYETLIKAIEILSKTRKDFEIDLIGGPAMPKDEKYLGGIKKLIQEKNLGEFIKFLGKLPNKDIVEHLQSADLFVNMGLTGSLDKVILEAMACGLPVLTCNEALTDVLGQYKEMSMYAKKDHKNLAEKIEFILKLNYETRKKIGEDLRNIVVENHGVERLITKILSKYQ